MSFFWTAIHAQLSASVRRVSSINRFVTMVARQTALQPHREPLSLLSSLHRRDGCPDAKNAALQALMSEAQQSPSGDLATKLLILALWPGLDAVRGRVLRFWRGPVADLDGELVGRLSLAIRSSDRVRVKRIAATLLRNLERDLRRDMMQEAQRQPTGAPIVPDTIVAPSPESDDLSRDSLASELRHRFPRDGELLAAVWLDGISQKAAGAAVGLSHDQARKRVQRAHRALVAASNADVSERVSQSARDNGFSSMTAPNRAPTTRAEP